MNNLERFTYKDNCRLHVNLKFKAEKERDKIFVF